MNSMVNAALFAATLALAPAAPAPPPVAPAAPVAPAPAAPPAARHADVPATVTLSADGRSIIIEGSLGLGTGERFVAVAQSAPNVRTVVLHSPGGLIIEAERVAGMVRARGFDTYVETACMSACAMILLSGRDRAVAPAAQIGFHAPALLNGEQPSAGSLRFTRRFFDSRGIAPAFTDHVFATPNGDMWFPSYEEMRAAGVVNRQTLGGETQAIFSRYGGPDELRAALRTVSYWQALEERFPDVAERAVAASMEVRARGGNDGDIGTAMRLVLVDAMPRLLAHAPPEIIEEFLELVVAETEAARRVSYAACDQFARGRLNVVAVLGPELARREMDLMERAVRASASPPPLDRPRAEQLLATIVMALPSDQADAIAAVEDPSAAQGTPETLCEGMIGMFRGIAALPQSDRQSVARMMFTFSEEAER
jgi:hypothetical protein